MQFIINTLVTTMAFSFCGIVATGFAQPPRPQSTNEKITIFPHSVVPHPFGEIKSIVKEWDLIKDDFKTSSLISSRETYFGDVVYIVVLYHNTSEEYSLSENILGYDAWNGQLQNVSITLSYKDEIKHYHIKTDSPSTSMSGAGLTTFFDPGTVSVGKVFSITLPPLAEWNSPFWTKLRSALETEKSVELTIDITPLENNGVARFNYSLSETILVKKRPDKEMTLLNGWYEATPYDKFPFYGSVYDKEPYDNGLSQFIPIDPSYDIRIEVSSQDKRDPPLRVGRSSLSHSNSHSLVVRFRNRLFYIPNPPKTLDKWRELEDEFSPSAIRDEIHLTTLLIEYAIAQNSRSDDLIEKQNNLLRWLEELPLAQRIALSYWIGIHFKELESVLDDRQNSSQVIYRRQSRSRVIMNGGRNDCSKILSVLEP
ncbi:MAG: hypothetical protein IJU03_09480 [Thermoguttaceae bacterium]|nr:hypothetical protein [Thermoguttaceae bacterium]